MTGRANGSLFSAWRSLRSTEKKDVRASCSTILIAQSRKQNKTGVTLTCKEHLIDYYQKFGFRDSGISHSTHGGETWHDMILTF